MNKCVIICAYNETSVKESVDLNDAYIICADAGIEIARKENIAPDLIIGDFDSAKEIPKGKNVIKLPKQKDETDTFFCVKTAIEAGFKDIIIAGGIGGRLDQTIANIQILKYAKNHGVKICLKDGNNTVYYLAHSSMTLEKSDKCKFSVFAYSPVCTGVSIKNALYELSDATLYSDFPIGTSNEFTGSEAQITVDDGELLIIISKDN